MKPARNSCARWCLGLEFPKPPSGCAGRRVNPELSQLLPRARAGGKLDIQAREGKLAIYFAQPGAWSHLLRGIKIAELALLGFFQLASRLTRFPIHQNHASRHSPDGSQIARGVSVAYATVAGATPGLGVGSGHDRHGRLPPLANAVQMLFPKSHKKIRPGADRVNSSASARSPARLDPSFEPRSRKTSGCITRHAQADGTRTSRTRRIRARARSRSNLHPACVSLARTRRAYLAVGSQKKSRVRPTHCQTCDSGSRICNAAARHLAEAICGPLHRRVPPRFSQAASCSEGAAALGLRGTKLGPVTRAH